jgi:sigma-B regulation protein RsbU (phosphoserine phosphatase)
MMKKQRYCSFSKRLTRRIMLALTLALIVVAACFNWLEADVFTNYYKGYCKILLDVKNETVRKALYGVEVAVNNSTDDLEEQLQSPATVFNALRDELQRNRKIVGFFACFEPNYYPSQGRSFQPYAFWRDGRIDTMQIAKKGNDYLEDDWYGRAFAADSGYWSEPYMDDAGSGALMCTYSVPIHDHTGRKVGVFGADISLDWLHEQLKAIDKEYNFFKGFIKSKRNIDTLSIFSSSIIIDSVGTFIVHPDKKRILKDNFYEALRQQKDTASLQLLKNMTAKKSGTGIATIDGLTHYVFYAPHEQTGWMMAIAVPRVIIMLPVVIRCLVLSFIFFLTLIAVYFICRYTIRRSTRPLHTLAKSADEVAKGNFNAPLPDIKHNDEIRLLRDSFGNMQQSLSQYIDELKTTTAQKTAIESELAIARDIQMSMLPNANLLPLTPHLAIHASMNPAKEVGGDLYDFFVRDDRLYFCIGDVAGKGVPAALVMSTARSAFRLLAETESEPQRIVSRMNDTMARDNDLSIFVTFFAGVLDLNTGHLSYCNAGHKVPYILSEKVETLSIDRNLPVGVMPDWAFTQQETTLASGSTLFLYTDGLDEAEDAEHNMFGKERIQETLQTISPEPHTLIEQMTQAVGQFVGKTEQSDDLTMLAIRYK